MDVSPASPIQPDDAVTMTATFEVVPGREQRFEHALRDIGDKVSTVPGFLGLQVIRPRGGGNDHHAVLRFDRLSNLKRWAESPERDTWFSLAEELTERPPRVVNIVRPFRCCDSSPNGPATGCTHNRRHRIGQSVVLGEDW